MVRQSRPAYALLDLLVAMTLLLVATGLSLPAAQGTREVAARLQCQNNLKQLGQAILGYESATGELPRGVYSNPLGGWTVKLLPYLERDDMLKLYRADRGYDHNDNQKAAQTRLPVVECPSAPLDRVQTGFGFNPGNPSAKGAMSDYMAAIGHAPGTYPAGDRSGFGPLMHVVDDYRTDANPTLAWTTDGASNTIVIFENAGRPYHYVGKIKMADTNPRFPHIYGPWVAPNNSWVYTFTADATTVAEAGPCTVNCNNAGGVYGFHPGVANVCFLDGSVRPLGEGLSPTVLFALVSRAGGEIINLNDY